AVVILGGTALGGGRGSVIATGVAVLFLSQLDQVLEVLGVSQAIQYVIQGAIVALSMGLRTASFDRWRSALRGRAGPAGGSSRDIRPGTEDSVVSTGAPYSGAGDSATEGGGRWKESGKRHFCGAESSAVQW